MFKVQQNIPLSDKQKGMLYAFLGYTGFGFADTCAKWLSSDYSVLQINATNYFTACLILLALSPLLGGVKSVKDLSTLKIQILRGIGNFISSLAVIYSLSILPMATVYTMVFATPFFSVLIAWFLYKERLKMDRALLLVVGFAGVVIAFQPWQDTLDYRLLLPLASSVFIALTFTTARSLKEGITLFSLGFTPLLVALIISLPFAIGIFTWPLMADLPVILVNGVFLCIGVIGVSVGFRMAAASVASPFMYTEIIWALLFGYLLFSDIPEIPMIVGAIIIMGCGFHLVQHEK